MSQRTSRPAIASQLFGYDLFISFALGPAPRGTQRYAADLARRLREHDFVVYFSDETLPPGEELDGSLRRALRRSNALVVVATRATLEDPRWVRLEVEEFRKSRSGRPIVPINVGGALTAGDLASAAQSWLPHRGMVWIDETAEAVDAGHASDDVLSRLSMTPTFRRANRRWRQTVGAAFAVLGILATALGVATLRVMESNEGLRQEIRRTTALRLASEAEATLAGTRSGGSVAGLLELLAAHRISPQLEVEGVMLDTLLGIQRMVKITETAGQVHSAVFSPDGSLILTGGRAGAILWSAQSLQPHLGPAKAVDDPVFSVAFSPDGARFVSAGADGTLRLRDTRNGQTIAEAPQGHEGAVNAVAFSPDGSLILSGGGDNALRFWNGRTGRPVGDALGRPDRENAIYSVAFSPDGTRAVAGGLDGSATFLSMRKLEVLSMASSGHDGAVNSLAYSPDGSRLASAGEDRTVRIRDARTGHGAATTLTGHQQSVSSIAFSPDGRQVVSGSWDATLRLWDATTGAQVGDPLTGHQGYVTSVSFSPDGALLLSSSWDRTIRLWNARHAEPISEALAGHVQAVKSVAFDPGGARILSGGGDGTLRAWDARSGLPAADPIKIPGTMSPVRSVACSPDGALVASGSSDGAVLLWDATQGNLVRKFVGHKGPVNGIAFSADGKRLASVGDDRTLALWDVAKGTSVASSQPARDLFRINGVAFDPKGDRIVTASQSGSGEQTLQLWDSASATPVGPRIAGHAEAGSWVSSVAYSPDGARIVSAGSDGTLQLWDSATGKPIGEPMRGHELAVSSVAFSPDGRRIVSGSQDKTLRFWDGHSGSPIGRPMRGHQRAVNSVAFSPDGTQVASGSDDGTLRRWPTPMRLADELCSRLTYNMSRTAWARDVSPHIDYVCQCPGLPVQADEPGLPEDSACRGRS